MLEPNSLPIAFIIITMVVIYISYSTRNIMNQKTETPQDYLWKLKQITDKSEYDLFHIAAEEKGWPKYMVERDFRRYLADQTLPVYVKQFLEDGKKSIDEYRCRRGWFFDKRLLAFYSLFTLVIIGGSFILSLYVLPWLINMNPNHIVATLGAS